MIEAEALPKDGNRVWSVTTAPSVEPITSTEVKYFARIDTSDDDTLIDDFIETARKNCEGYIGRALINQTITLKMDYWPGNVIELPRPPLVSITAVETLDEDDTATTYSSDNYYTITEAIPGKLVIKQGVTPPFQSGRDYGGYQIRFVAGYGAAASNVPAAIRTALIYWVARMYEDRVVSDKPPPEAMSLLNLHRVMRFE